MKTSPSILVIGSGMAGLTAAAALTQARRRVIVFEQADHIGGVTASFEQDGYSWDLGQLMIEGLGAQEPVGGVLAALGVLSHIQPVKDDRGYVFPDFELRKPVDYQGPQWRMDLLKRRFPQDKRGLDRYWQDYVRFTRLMTFARRAESASGLAAKVWQARLYAALLPFLSRKDWSAARLMRDYFTAEPLRCVFTSILADFFTPPSQFLGLGVFSLNPEASFDCRTPAALAPDAEQVYQYTILGGVGRLSEALARQVTAQGGTILTNRAVQRIQIETGRVMGVIDSQGETHPAQAVLASGGARRLFEQLVGDEYLTPAFVQQVQNLPLMDSIFMLHLGVDFDPSPYVHGVTTYYYGTYDIEGGIEEARRGVYHQGKAGFVVHVPTLKSPQRAPSGHHAMTIYTICPNRLAQGSWSELKESFADQLIAYAGRILPGLADHIRVRAILTPEDFQARTYTERHAFGGLAPVLGAQRIPHATPIAGLWFIGAQSESGGGVNNVIPAAYKTAQQVLKVHPAA